MYYIIFVQAHLQTVLPDMKLSGPEGYVFMVLIVFANLIFLRRVHQFILIPEMLLLPISS